MGITRSSRCPVGDKINGGAVVHREDRTHSRSSTTGRTIRAMRMAVTIIGNHHRNMAGTEAADIRVVTRTPGTHLPKLSRIMGMGALEIVEGMEETGGRLQLEIVTTMDMAGAGTVGTAEDMVVTRAEGTVGEAAMVTITEAEEGETTADPVEAGTTTPQEVDTEVEIRDHLFQRVMEGRAGTTPSLHEIRASDRIMAGMVTAGERRTLVTDGVEARLHAAVVFRLGSMVGGVTDDTNH